MERLQNIIIEIKETIKENKLLEIAENKYKELLNSPQGNIIVNKLKEIKNMKENINHFLLEEGIIIPQT